MSNYNIEIERELSQLKLDQDRGKHELENEKMRIASLLLNDMGKDIDDVINGKVAVKMSYFEKLKYKIKFILNKIFNTL